MKTVSAFCSLTEIVDISAEMVLKFHLKCFEMIQMVDLGGVEHPDPKGI